VFRVSDARASIVEILKQDDIEVIKQMQPWPKQTKEMMAKYAAMNSEELTKLTLHIPPFHPFCRTLAVKLKVRPATVPTTVPSDLPALPPATPVPTPTPTPGVPVKPVKAVGAAAHRCSQGGLHDQA